MTTLAFRSPMQNAMSSNQSTFGILMSNNPPAFLWYVDQPKHCIFFPKKIGSWCNWHTKNPDLFPKSLSAQCNEINARLHHSYASFHKISVSMDNDRSSPNCRRPKRLWDDLNGLWFCSLYARFSGIESFWNMDLQLWNLWYFSFAASWSDLSRFRRFGGGFSDKRNAKKVAKNFIGPIAQSLLLYCDAVNGSLHVSSKLSQILNAANPENSLI